MALSPVGAFAAPGDRPPHVVVLYSDSVAFPGSAEFDHSLRQHLAAAFGDRIDIDSDFLDLRRADSADYTAELTRLLASKYAAVPADLVVVAGSPALRFALAHRGQFSPGAPLLFAHVERRELEHLELPADVAGLVSRWDFAELGRIALQLRPDTRHLVLVSGNTELERNLEEITYGELADLAPGMVIERLSDKSVPEMEQRIASLPEHSAVVFISVYRDATGASFIPRNVLHRLAAVANAPVYSLIGQAVGRGTVGAGQLDFTELGEVAGEAAIRLLRGDPPTAVGVRYMPLPTLKFDARQLERWGIPRDRLPGGSVLFERVSPWREYRWRIAAIALLIGIQTAMIVGLIDALRMRRKAEATRLRSEVRASAVLDALHERVVVLDRQGVITSANRSWEDFVRSYGRDDMSVGANFIDTCRNAAERGNRDAWRTLEGVVAVLEGRQKRFELHYSARPNEDGRWSALTAVPLAHEEAGAVVSIADVSERRRLEALMQQQRAEIAHIGRVATLGELSAAIAHEINQPLAGILTNAQAAQRLLDAEEADLATVGEALDDIVADGRRARDVIQQLRNLLHKGPLELAPVDVNEVVEEVVHLTATDMLLRGATMDLELAQGLAPVAADRVHLQQVLINLILNGLDAMTENPRELRRLTVRTAAAPDGRVAIEIRDRGSGIHGEILAKLFEPFQTTKPKGMGMGLSIVRSVVEGHGGKVSGVNNPAGGATFTVALPALEPTA